MGVVRCIRCDSHIDLDYNVEGAVCNDLIPGLTKNDQDWVCDNCLTEDEQERLSESLDNERNAPISDNQGESSQQSNIKD